MWIYERYCDRILSAAVCEDGILPCLAPPTSFLFFVSIGVSMFSPRDKATACGMWSGTYIIALAITLTLAVTAIYLSRKMKERGVRRLLLASSVFTISTEIVKMVFVGVTYGIEEVEFIPLYFCSLFMYSTVLALTKRDALRNTGLAFLFFGGIIGAVGFFSYPDACIPNYPIYHFMCLRTMIFHGLMIYVGFTVVLTGYYKPSVRHFKNYLAAMCIVGIGAYIYNLIFDTNLMYISKPLGLEISAAVYQAAPKLYPLIFMTAQIFAPFFASYGVYRAVLYFINKRHAGAK